MRCIAPITVTDSNFNASGIPEPDTGEALWSNAVSYSTGDLALVTDAPDPDDDHWIYISLQDSNLNHYPPDSPAWWAKYQRSNRWRMWDNRRKSVSSESNSITASITPGILFNATAILGIKSDTLNITVNDPTEGDVYDEDIDLIDLTGINDFYPWFFEPLKNKENIILTDLPAFPAATIYLTATNTGDTVEIGEWVVGRLKILGSSGYPTSGSIDNYNRKIEDDLGFAIVEERGFQSLVDYVFHYPASDAYDVRNFIGEFLTDPGVWLGYVNEDPDLAEETVLFGIVKDFSYSVSDKYNAEGELSIEELV